MTYLPFRVMNGVLPDERLSGRRKGDKSAAGGQPGKEQRMYIKTMENRKDLVKRIEQLTDEKAVYTRMPECAFEIGEFKVERYGTLVFTEEADTEVIDTLLAEGLIRVYEPEEGTDVEGTEGTEDTEEAAEDPEPVEVTISLPMANHTVRSLRNLTAMLYSRGGLISKATGGQFSCTEDLLEALSTASDIPAFLNTLESHPGALEGLELSADTVTFTGFPETDRADRIQTFTTLASLMNRMALEQKHTLARPVMAENEKYSFRIWLISLGMKGDEFKTARRILLALLDGNAAFKDEAMKERWKEKRRAASQPMGAENAERCDAEIVVTVDAETEPVGDEDVTTVESEPVITEDAE